MAQGVPGKQRKAGVAATLLLVGLLVVLWLALGTQVYSAALSHDFLNFYTGASLARDGQFARLHDVSVQLARERELVPSTKELVPFVRLHTYALALAPLSWLPYRTAFFIWMGIQWLILFGCWAWAWRRWGADAAVWGALSLPAGIAIAHGQDAPVFLAIAIAGYAQAEKGRDRLAGALWSLGLIKFHLILLLPVAMIATRRWKMLQGFMAGGALFGLSSLALGGAEGIQNYIAMLRNKDLSRLSPTPEQMVNLQSIAENFRLVHWGFVAAAGMAVTALALAALRGAPLWRWYAVAISAGLVLAPHVYAYDATMLTLALWLAIYESRHAPTRAVAALFLMPFVPLLNLAGMPWSAAGAIVLLCFVCVLGVEAVRREQAGSLSPVRS